MMEMGGKEEILLFRKLRSAFTRCERQVHVAIAIDVDAVGLYYQSANAISVRTSSQVSGRR